MQTTIEFETLAPPKNQKAHLLRDMILGKMIAEQDYRYNRFRGNISDLINDYGVPIQHRDVPFESSFGYKSHYRKHYLLTIDRDKAIEIYNKINKKQP